VIPPPTDSSAHDIVKLTVEIGYRQAAFKLGWSRSRLYDFISKKHQKLYTTLVESSKRSPKNSLTIGERTPSQALENRERVVSTSISRSRSGQILAHPGRNRVPRRIEPGTTLLAFQKEKFVVIGWSNGCDVGNGCLNLVLARPRHAQEIDDYWRHNGLESRYIFKKVSKKFYAGTPAENIPELQDGEEIIDPSTKQIVGYYHVPAAAAVPDYYLITEGPFGH
jgi:hypothetical protein